jgi:hypothetical protein
MGGALAGEIAAGDRLLAAYRGGFVVADGGVPLGHDTADPRELATAVRERTGADIGIAAVIAASEPAPDRPSAEFAVDVRGIARTDSSRWNFRMPELRRRAAIESLVLLLNTLRGMD